MAENSGESAESHTTTVKYTDETQAFLDEHYPDALSTADAIRHAIGDARKFNELVEEATLDGEDD